MAQKQFDGPARPGSGRRCSGSSAAHFTLWSRGSSSRSCRPDWGACDENSWWPAGSPRSPAGPVLPDRTRHLARWWLLATLVAVYPANINMAVNSKDFPNIPAPALWARLPLQFVFARITWRGTR
ncbi:hypothetical protein [Mycobacterium sp.]|jgi:hypothetical protein|uniref:DoxX family protein n=1 Tax=Mycobacterium sp. TaxID=1785 RepID=UPI0033421FCD